LDLGVRYRVNKLVTLCARLDNALDKSHWDTNSFGQLSVGEPRSFSLSATFDF
jgi:iron complex outermembrane recepter protein